MTRTRYRTLVWCLPGSTKASLVITTDDGESHSVLLDATEMTATRDACNVALARMKNEDPLPSHAAGTATNLTEQVRRLNAAVAEIATECDLRDDEYADAGARRGVGMHIADTGDGTSRMSLEETIERTLYPEHFIDTPSA